jgi:hypothetical protein
MRSGESDSEQSARVSRKDPSAGVETAAPSTGSAANRKFNWNFEMFNNYFISPIYRSTSIYLTYQGDQPFASFGRKTLVPGTTGTLLPSAPPQDNIARALVTEVLQLCPSCDIEPAELLKHLLGDETGPIDRRRSLYRNHERSQYSMLDLDDPFCLWHEATVKFEGKEVPMLFSNDGILYNDDNSRINEQATKLGEQADTKLPKYFNGKQIQNHMIRTPLVIRYDAYLVLGQMWKPFADIRTPKYPRASDFGSDVGPLFKGWWHAVRISNGWRLYADDKNELFHAKMKF